MDINRKLLGLAIRNVRKARRVTQQQLAKAVGVTTTHVSLLENGQRGASMETLNKIAATLDIPTATLTCLGTKASGAISPTWARLMRDFQQLILDVVARDFSTPKH